MKLFRLVRGAAIALACLGLFVPQISLAAAPTAQDVALGQNGQLLGQVLDGQGIPVAGSLVVVKQNGQRLASGRTDQSGRFAFAGLRGGIYELRAGGSSNLCRTWAAGTAPPAAVPQVLLAGSVTTRAQGCDACGAGGCDDCCGGGGGGWLTNPWTIAAIAAVAIAVPLALDDDGS